MQERMLTAWTRLGFGLVILGSIAPILNGVRVIFFQHTFSPDDYSMYFISSIGPWNLILAGVIGIGNVFFFFKKQIAFSWWLHFFAIIWIGVGDSIGAFVFLSKFNLSFFPVGIPIIVTSMNLIGLLLIKKFTRTMNRELS